MSPIPLVLDTEPLSATLESRYMWTLLCASCGFPKLEPYSSIPWKDLFIADMKSERASGLVATSFSCSLGDDVPLF